MFAEITRAPPKLQEGRTTPQHPNGDPRGFIHRLTCYLQLALLVQAIRMVRIAQLGDCIHSHHPDSLTRSHGFWPQRPTASTEEKGSLMSQIAKIAAHSGSVVKITWGLSENGLMI